MRCMILRGFALVAALAALPAIAQESTPSSGVFKTGQQVFDLCRANDRVSRDQCHYFFMAAHDMMKFYGDTGLGGAKICPPRKILASAMADAVVRYWRDKPGTRQYSAVSSTYNALAAAYPC